MKHHNQMIACLNDEHLVIRRCGILCQINGGARDWEKKRGKRVWNEFEERRGLEEHKTNGNYDVLGPTLQRESGGSRGGVRGQAKSIALIWRKPIFAILVSFFFLSWQESLTPFCNFLSLNFAVMISFGLHSDPCFFHYSGVKWLISEQRNSDYGNARHSTFQNRVPSTMAYKSPNASMLQYLPLWSPSFHYHCSFSTLLQQFPSLDLLFFVSFLINPFNPYEICPTFY
uniref:Uncharacterized protein n=1 Tax=Cucumis melo TaxID=3656 RepID=A0A9I9EAJ6_CUCME